MSNGIDGHTVLITGAAGDIGRAAAVRLAQAGATLVLTDRDVDDRLVATARACRDLGVEHGPEHRVVAFDVTRQDEVADAFGRLAADGVVADRLFNNAGYQGAFANLADYPVADLRTVLDVNVAGVFNVLQVFARTLVAADRGGVVVNSASMAKNGAPNMAAYSASKAAVVALTVTASKDLAESDIRVNSISPAFIGPGDMWERQVALQARTPSQYFADDPNRVAEQMIDSIPMRRYGTLDEVASVVQFLLSDDSSYITGFDIEVSGGAA